MLYIENNNEVSFTRYVQFRNNFFFMKKSCFGRALKQSFFQINIWAQDILLTSSKCQYIMLLQMMCLLSFSKSDTVYCGVDTKPFFFFPCHHDIPPELPVMHSLCIFDTLELKFNLFNSHGRELRMQKWKSHLLKTLSLSFKAWSRSVYSRTRYAYCQGFLPFLFLPFQSIHLHFFQNLLIFSWVSCG